MTSSSDLSQNFLNLLKEDSDIIHLCGVSGFSEFDQRYVVVTNGKPIKLSLYGKEGVIVILEECGKLPFYAGNIYKITYMRNQTKKLTRWSTLAFIMYQNNGVDEIVGVFSIKSVDLIDFEVYVQFDRLISCNPMRITKESAEYLKRNTYLSASKTAELLGQFSYHTNDLVNKASAILLKALQNPLSSLNALKDKNRLILNEEFNKKIAPPVEISEHTLYKGQTHQFEESLGDPDQVDLNDIRKLFSRKRVLLLGGLNAYSFFNFLVSKMQSDMTPVITEESTIGCSSEWAGIQGTHIRFFNIDNTGEYSLKYSVLVSLLELGNIDILILFTSPVKYLQQQKSRTSKPDYTVRYFPPALTDLLTELNQSTNFNGRLVWVPSLPMAINVDSDEISGLLKKHNVDRPEDVSALIGSAEKQIRLIDGMAKEICQSYPWARFLDVYQESLSYLKHRLEDGMNWNRTFIGWLAKKIYESLSDIVPYSADFELHDNEPALVFDNEINVTALGVKKLLPLPSLASFLKISKFINQVNEKDSKVAIEASIREARIIANEKQSSDRKEYLTTTPKKRSIKLNVIDGERVVLFDPKKTRSSAKTENESEFIVASEPKQMYDNVPFWIEEGTQVVFYDKDYEKWFYGSVLQFNNEEIVANYRGYKGYQYSIKLPGELNLLRSVEEHENILAGQNDNGDDNDSADKRKNSNRQSVLNESRSGSQ